ncbi:hypothetical protein CAPTEDRAFT_229286 [Capitella teleta]|uniref:SRA1/Sec31 domain-containing protein n=1 Tax=Capitella teleta TaxID=283909 RepID=R7TL50_CAPTE|nr:hypothetical protein CAPTEDRAFT_229286 [Capitella teleta]|eukprot:ELT91810.1 hypothetical protein CAPTEDRAFT_229286 [Capitella teleta]
MAQPSRPGNHDRGWNDPPMFLQSETTTSQPPPKRSALTKRVAAYPGMQPPGQKSEPVPLPAGVVLFPPTPSTDVPRYSAPIIVPTMSPKDSTIQAFTPPPTNPITNMPVSTDCNDLQLSIPDFDDDDQLYHFVVTRLRRVLLDCSAVLQARVAEEVDRKLTILSQMWKDGKISYPVKSKMAHLSTALHVRKCDMAHQIHLGLMMDYVSEVGPWMVGIKRLIQEARNIQPPLSPTDSTTMTTTTSPLASAATTMDTDQCEISNTNISQSETAAEQEEAELSSNNQSEANICDHAEINDS